MARALVAFTGVAGIWVVTMFMGFVWAESVMSTELLTLGVIAAFAPVAAGFHAVDRRALKPYRYRIDGVARAPWSATGAVTTLQGWLNSIPTPRCAALLAIWSPRCTAS